MFLVVGCNGGKKSTITVVRHPEFYQPELKRVAVIPFGDQSGNPEAAKYMGRRLETALVNNKTYEVYTREHLKEVLSEQDLAAAGIVDSDVARRIGKLGSVQALICGVCSRYGSKSREVMVEKWVYSQSGSYTVKVPVTLREAIVECNVVVIDTSTGKHLAAVNSSAPFSWRSDMRAPKNIRRMSVIQVAESLCLARIIDNIAVTKKEVKLKGKPLRIATGQYDAKWDVQDRIIPADQKLFAVVALPSEAAHNTFKITIVPKDKRVDLAEQTLVWPEQTTDRGYAFDVKPLVDKNGLGVYQAKLYSGPEPVAWYDFEIVEKR